MTQSANMKLSAFRDVVVCVEVFSTTLSVFVVIVVFVVVPIYCVFWTLVYAFLYMWAYQPEYGGRFRGFTH